ncbi:hypothetical protein KY329_05375 [Candidatus Woesearchaeota archaeon]|nr:hypothetical protein [Candidatus Woesearchaeota archaeon]
MSFIPMTNQVFVPALAEKAEQVESSMAIQKPLKGYSTGLMLFIRNGMRGISLDSTVELQYSNLRQLDYGTAPIVTMLSNHPYEEIDFLHNPEYATMHVKKGIDFARGLPIGGERLLTFHLNSLVPKEEFLDKTEKQWKDIFGGILPFLERIARYARDNAVGVKVESVPVPDFGDVPDSDKRTYRGVRLNQLRNPFYISHKWGFDEIRNAGLGICLDICHNRTLYVVARSGDKEHALFDSDREEFAGKSLFADVGCLKHDDLVHLNDGDGIYSKETVFREGIALGKGDIAELREIIRYLDAGKIAYVLEINETDLVNRPNTVESIRYLLEESKHL